MRTSRWEQPQSDCRRSGRQGAAFAAVRTRREWRRREGFMMGVTLLMLMVLFTLGVAFLQVAPINLQLSTLALRTGQLLDTAQAGLAEAEYEVLQNPNWRTGVPTTAFDSGSYTVSVTGAQNQLFLGATAVDGRGRTLMVNRQVAIGSKAFAFTIYSQGNATIRLGPQDKVIGGVYGYSGVNLSRGDFSQCWTQVHTSNGTDIRLPSVRWQDYETAYGFDEYHTGSTVISGDHSDAQIIFVDGNCSMDLQTGPVGLGTLIVTGDLDISGTAGGPRPLSSRIMAGAADSTRRLPAILCYGQITASTGAVDPLVVYGAIWCASHASFKNLTLNGNLLAGGNVDLSSTDPCRVEQRSPLWDPLTYPPFMVPNSFGTFLVHLGQTVQ